MANKPTSIKTINQKIRRLGRKYGTDSLEYKNYLADVDRNFTTHTTKDGIIQINQPKNMSKYQSQILNKLSKRKGVRQLETEARRRLFKEAEAQGKKVKGKGAYRPTKQEVEQEVRQFSDRQQAVDNALDLIYIEESEGSLPSDISLIYNKMHRRGKGAGSGISNAELDEMIEKINRWQSVKKRVEELSRELEALGYVDSYIEGEVWACMSGQYALDTIENDIIPTLERYLEQETT